MFNVSMRGSRLFVNDINIVNLREPFIRIVHRSEGIDSILRLPSETLIRPHKPLSYYVKINETKAGALYSTETHGLQAHWVYSTNSSVSNIFRDKALQTVLTKLDCGFCDNICRYLSVVIKLLIDSYSFDYVITTLDKFKVLCSSPHLIDKSHLIKLPQKPHESKRYKMIKAILRGHPGGLPSRLLDWTVYNEIDLLRHTTLDIKAVREYSRILVLTGTNHQYAGFLARELYKIPHIREVLPVSLFYLNTSGS